MSYSIARLSKVKSSINTTGIQKHVQRENKNYNNKDIDHEKTGMNYDLIHGRSKQNFKKLIDKRIQEGYTGQRKIRSDAIRHVDGIMTSDNEFFRDMDPDQVKTYFKDSLEFLKNEYGKENLIYAAVHLDEATPHMHFGVVPLTKDGRLSAKEVLGNKKALTQFQDRYNAFMNEKGYALERGQPKHMTEKKHQDTDKFKQETKYYEQAFQKAQNKAQAKEKRLDELAAAIEPQEVQYEGHEIKTEVKSKLFGKPEIEETKTGNVVLTPEQYEKVNEQVTAAAAIQKDYEQLKNTDLAKENESLRQQIKEISNNFQQEMINRLNAENENRKLKKENKQLKGIVTELKRDLKLVYATTRQFIKERTKDLKAFKSNFKSFMDDLNGKHAEIREKRNMPPRKNEFEVIHENYEKTAAKKKDRGLER